MRINLDAAHTARNTVLALHPIDATLTNVHVGPKFTTAQLLHRNSGRLIHLEKAFSHFLYADTEQWLRQKVRHPNLQITDIRVRIEALDQGYNPRFPECWRYEFFRPKITVLCDTTFHISGMCNGMLMHWSEFAGDDEHIAATFAAIDTKETK